MAHNSELMVKRMASLAPVSDIDPANLADIAGELNAPIEIWQRFGLMRRAA
jgi:hypothetical protein